MASSSVSQESLDREDYEVMARRSRIRVLRGRVVPHKTESLETTDDKDQEEEEQDEKENGEFGSPAPMTSTCGDHESPTRAASRLKDKRGRPNHLHKGKGAVKDKRKLREKRRSTGVVHLASTESTGDSLDEEDQGTDQTRRNTTYNEVIDADNPQTPEEERKGFSSRSARNKSPSDLDADLEDNQDYDSTVSQSETNLTTIGQSSPQPAMVATKFRLRNSPDSKSRSVLASHSQNKMEETSMARPMSYPVHFKGKDPLAEGFPYTGSGMGTGGLVGRGAGQHSHSQRYLPDKGDVSSSSDSCVRSSAAENHVSESVEDAAPATSTQPASQEPIENQLLAKTVQLEKLLEQEREEKRRLQELLDERDGRIAQLECEVAQLNRELEAADGENGKLRQENRTLLRAISSLSTCD